MTQLLRALLVLALLSAARPAAALGVTVLTPTSVSMAWEASPDATQYVVQQAPHADGPYADAVWTSQTTETVAGLLPGATYYWVVRAVNSANQWSGPSNIVSITMPTGPTIDDCRPFVGTFAVGVTPTSLLLTGNKGPGTQARLDFQVASPNSPVNRITIAIDGVIVLPVMGCPTEAVDCGAVMTPLAGYWFSLPASGAHLLTVTAANRKGCTTTASYGRGLTVP